jgi:hypothetical protein
MYFAFLTCIFSKIAAVKLVEYGGEKEGLHGRKTKKWPLSSGTKGFVLVL